ncbi:hypothetical protein [Angustibacter luteus]|uniref:Secreted protein n=1 Tax=Angustibacter luteus TaxID=658456 RepID=A0ABW1JEB0_9ACTN
MPSRPSRPRRVVLTAALAAGALVGTVPWLIAPAASAAPTVCPPPLDERAAPDYDGDFAADLTVGVPTGLVGGVPTGAVDIHYAQGRAQRVGPASFIGIPAAAGDLFGASVESLPPDQTADSCDDLAIGAPGSDRGRGAVVIAHGSLTGLTSAGAVRLTGRSAGERFGASIALGSASADTTSYDLYVGAPNRTVSGRAGAGAVDIYRVQKATGAATYLGAVTEDTPGVPGVAEAGDHFGTVLAFSDTLAVGVPDETSGSHRQAGDVVLVKTSTTGAVTAARLLQQGYQGLPGVAETGDRVGAALSWSGDALWVGEPGEAIGRAAGAGQVQVFRSAWVSRSSGDVGTITQNTYAVPGTVQAGDHFGASVNAQGNLCSAQAAAVGSPGEDIGSVRDAGEVTIVLSVAGANACQRSYHQGPGGGLGGAAEAGDQVGAALSALNPWDSLDLVVGIPGEGVGSSAHAGGVTVVHPGLAPRSYGDSAGRVTNSRYGAVLEPSAW